MRSHRQRIPSYTRAVLGVAVVVSILGGCRTYGGYGTEQAILQQIQEANRQFATSLERARADLKMLREAATRNPELEKQAVAFQRVVEEHEMLLREHTDGTAELEADGSSYRTLSRFFGAVVSEQESVHSRYHDIMFTVGRELGLLDEREPEAMASYQSVPPYYARIRSRLSALTMRQVTSPGS